jgi:hypothetical protein
MRNPVKVLFQAGYNLADKAGSRAAKSAWLKDDITPKEKSQFTGAMGLILGAGLTACALQVAAPALMLGAFFCWFNLFADLGLQLLGAGALATTAAVFTAGVAAGGDKQCGFSKAATDILMRATGRLHKAFVPAQAPAVEGLHPAAPETKSALSAQAAVPAFAKAAANDGVAPALAALVPGAPPPAPGR